VIASVNWNRNCATRVQGFVACCCLREAEPVRVLYGGLSLLICRRFERPTVPR
jgi:hypothetical protein